MEQTPKLAITTFILVALGFMNLGLQSPAHLQSPRINIRINRNAMRRVSDIE